MRRELLIIFILCLLSGLLSSGRGAFATGVLTPEWDKNHQMPLKSLDVKSTIEGNVAKTTCSYDFGNDCGSWIEAFFWFTLPERGVVTEFAYYFQGKRVKAYIVEDARAMAIFESIKAQSRDPALVKRMKGNTFKARIFPIEAEGVKIELTYLHPLPSFEGKREYIFDLTGPNSSRKIESFNFACQFTLPYPVLKATCNYPSTLTLSKGAPGVLSMKAPDFTPAAPLKVLIQPQVSGLQTYLTGGLSGGREGFFALSLTPPIALQSPRLSIYGIHTFYIYPPLPAKLSAGETLTVVGRYLPGEAMINLTGYNGGHFISYDAPKTFSRESIPNGSATKLWADEFLKVLAKRARAEKNKNLVDLTVKTSMRFGVMSDFTSFLAVPESELEAYYRSLGYDIDGFKYVIENIGKGKRENYSNHNEGKPFIALDKKFARGDPLILVDAPADALSVVALFPDGTCRDLAFDKVRKQWVTRFVIPFDADEGNYDVTILITLKESVRKTIHLSYNVARAAPTGNVTLCSPGEDTVTLEVQGDDSVARVVALLPWGQDELLMSSWDRVFKKKIAVPREFSGEEYCVQLLLLDKAHNRLVITKTVESLP